MPSEQQLADYCGGYSLEQILIRLAYLLRYLGCWAVLRYSFPGWDGFMNT